MSTEIFHGSMFLRILVDRRDQIIQRKKEVISDFVAKHDSNAEAEEQLLNEEYRLLNESLKLVESLIHTTSAQVARSQQRAVKEMRERQPPIQFSQPPPPQPTWTQRPQPRFTRVKTKTKRRPVTNRLFSESEVNCSLASVDPPWQWSWGNGFVAFSDMLPMPRFHTFDTERIGGRW